jgi:hypothetical protein
VEIKTPVRGAELMSPSLFAETAVPDLPVYVVVLTLVGAFCFGLVVGWVTYSILRRAQRGNLSDIATIIGTVGGAAVIALFPISTGAFGAYSIGLALGFFGYLGFAALFPNSTVVIWMGQMPAANPNPNPHGRLPPDQ